VTANHHAKTSRLTICRTRSTSDPEGWVSIELILPDRRRIQVTVGLEDYAKIVTGEAHIPCYVQEKA